MTSRAPRFFADVALASGTSLLLPESAARHVQVLRLQPGDALSLFSGLGPEGEFEATVERMGRNDVQVMVGAFTPTARENRLPVHLVLSMPANDRMDWLIEKATELGAASIQPLVSERSVLRLKSDRADKKVARWIGIAQAACEQSGRNRVPIIHEVRQLEDWLDDPEGGAQSAAGSLRLLLSLAPGSRPLAHALGSSDALAASFVFLSGPEGGLTTTEENAALRAGFQPVTLGPRVLRAETAPLACLSLLGLMNPEPTVLTSPDEPCRTPG
ncbi:MAG: 16S rRNA (uracil(1498)-N(3))-methyltransferase [Pseudomonadota bacterium]